MRMLLALAFLAALPAHAATIVLDFAEEVPDRQLVSFTASGATFTTSGGGYDEAGLALMGGALIVLHNTVFVSFDEPVSEVSIDFGLDLPSEWQAGAYARLRAGLMEVTEPLNLDGLFNQSIGVSGIEPFRSIEFNFVDAVHGDAAFAIDNLRFETVPEPGTLGLGLLGVRRVVRVRA